MNPFTIPIRRPMATSMFFLGVVLIGLIAFLRIPVELFPDVSGNEISVSYSRPSSEPEVVEREILLPLERRVAELPGVAETWGDVQGSGGTFRVRFERGSDLKVRELELQQIAAGIARGQPRGTFVAVQPQLASVISRFAMVIQVTGTEDRFALYDFVDERINPRLSAVPGVKQVFTFGAAGRQVTVYVDPDRCTALGVTPDQVTTALQDAVQRLQFLGGVEDEAGRTAVILDGRPEGVVSLGNTRIVDGRAVLLRHVARIEEGPGREQSLYRVNGENAIGLFVFQDETANLVRLGRDLRRKMDELQTELEPLGLKFVVTVDAAKLVEDQIDRLQKLALSGFVIALLVLYLFLRQWRAVAVVAVAVPVSLLVAMALLYMSGQTFNIVTLVGLAVGIGLLVDNSVVVYEAVQRRLERGADADEAAISGVQRTVRAIVAASVTTGIVFLPLVLADFDDATTRSLVEIVSLAILLPLAGSLLVAVGLVPLLAHRLAATAAIRQLAELRQRKRERGGLVAPDLVRSLFSGLVTAGLRQPATLITLVVAAVLATILIVPIWFGFNLAGQEATQADQVQLPVRVSSGKSLQSIGREVLGPLEQSALQLTGVERVESSVQESASGVNGSLTVHLAKGDARPPDLTLARIRQAVKAVSEKLAGVEVLRPGEGSSGQGGGQGGLGQALGGGPSEVVLSGPDMTRLKNLAFEIRSRLTSIPEVDQAWLSSRAGQEELHVIPDKSALASFGLTADQLMPVLRLVGRDGQRMPTGFTQADGRELPLVVRRAAFQRASKPPGLASLKTMRVATTAGVLPVALLSDVRQMPAPLAVSHHNGRREMSVSYRLKADAPSSGPQRVALEERIANTVREIHRPQGTTVDVAADEEVVSWFRRIIVPAILLLYLVLAMTFESLTLPVLVLVALPLTLLGSTWALVIAGMPLDLMVMVGALALLGLTVNPAILLVDRMQQRLRAGAASPGAAALAAVRERARPVFMTTATTVAGLAPLAQVSGRENEIWPPFAVIVIGGLVTSTILTLLVVPVGYVFLARLDRLFGRLGSWVVLAWFALTAAVMAPLLFFNVITSIYWGVVTTILVAGLLLGAVVLFWRREPLPEPIAEGDGPPVLEVRHLRKTYGLPGPVGKAWREPEVFARRVLETGGQAFDRRDARDRILAWLLVAAGLGYLALAARTMLWSFVLLMATAVVASRLVVDIRRARGLADPVGRVRPGGPENALAFAFPWLAVLFFAYRFHGSARMAEREPEIGLFPLVIVLGLIVLVQFGRWTARRLADGQIAERLDVGPFRRPRTTWRRLARRVFGLDLPREEVRALANVNFRAEGGMIGILGPNGAGKTTLLRQLAGILDPSRGRILLGGVHLDRLRRYLARWVGYLPQDTALPPSLSAREYLEYYALLYEIPAEHRGQRIETLLTDVGLAERADEKIGGYSGGMRQRVAVARTLLRLPPVIIVDEPTVGLDPRERIRFRNLLSNLARGRVVLFSTHVVEDVAVACERVIVLAGGRLRFDGPPQELTEAARGQVWEVSLPNPDISSLPEDIKIADQVPEESGRSRLRILSDHSPHPEARPAEPTLEEGYLSLVGDRLVGERGVS